MSLDQHCDRCLRPFALVWLAHDEMWNEVVKFRWGILCPECFAALAASDNGISISWTPIVDFVLDIASESSSIVSAET